MGRAEFEVWSDRIIAGALVSANRTDQQFILCNMILSLGPTESHKPDGHFIHALRKYAANQVADVMRQEIHKETKERKAAEELAANKEALERVAIVPGA